MSDSSIIGKVSTIYINNALKNPENIKQHFFLENEQLKFFALKILSFKTEVSDQLKIINIYLEHGFFNKQETQKVSSIVIVELFNELLDHANLFKTYFKVDDTILPIVNSIHEEHDLNKLITLYERLYEKTLLTQDDL